MKIQFINGEFAGEIRDFQETEISIGREDGNTIQLLTGGVSRYHAQILKQDDGNWIICDLDSTNGVKIGGKSITSDVILTPGMELVIGEQKIVVLETIPTGQIHFFPSSGSGASADTARMNYEIPAQQPVPPPPAPAPAPAPVQAPSISGEKLLADLKSAGNSLFSRNEKLQPSSVSPQKKDSAGNVPPKRSKMLFNIIFYAALAICVACVAKLFLENKKNAPVKSEQAIDSAAKNAVVYFERIAYSPEAKTAFRFEMKIEDGKMICFLDDISGQRHFKRELNLAENYETEFEVLLQKLKKSGIFQFKPKNISTPDPERDQIHLMLVYGNDFCNYKCSSTESGVEFDKCNQAIRDFLNSFGLVTIAQNREELEEEAKQHLQNAIDKRENYLSDLSMLREAAREFEAAISCYEQFSPAPPELKKARTGFAEVNELRLKKLKECTEDFKRCHRRMDYQGMRRACQDIMKISGEKSKAYRNAAETLRTVNRAMNSKKR